MNAEWSDQPRSIMDDLAAVKRYAEQHIGYEPTPCDRGEHAWKYFGSDLQSYPAVRCLLCGEPNPDHPAVKKILEQMGDQ